MPSSLAIADCSDDALFDPYQPARLPYDLSNPFDRTSLATGIQRQIDRSEDYLSLALCLFSDGRMSREDYSTRTERAAAQLRHCRHALLRLGEIGSY
ncbi:MAG TPA: hypothetical protein VGM38_02480 [Pseudolysinimonas sp.]|jgi:hypothetical protein